MHKIGSPLAARAPRLSEILTLRKTPIFSDLPEEAVRDTLMRCAVRSYAEGLSIFNEGEPAAHVFLVLAGNASVNVCDARGRWWRVHMASPGDLLGVSAAISGGPYRLSAVCESPLTLGIFHCDDFFAFLRRFPQAYFHVAECLSKDLAAPTTAWRPLASSLDPLEVRRSVWRAAGDLENCLCPRQLEA